MSVAGYVQSKEADNDESNDNDDDNEHSNGNSSNKEENGSDARKKATVSLCASCDRCRARKTKCDGRKPCVNCASKYMKKHKLNT
jgi:hypothetical protein